MIGYIKYFFKAFMSSSSEDDENKKKLNRIEKKLQNLKSSNDIPLEENIEKLLFLKKKINRLKKALKDNNNLENRRELEEQLSQLWKVYEAVEDKLKKSKYGLYMGVGIDLLKENDKMHPVWFNWKTLNSHMGVQGTTRTGKTVLLINMAKQVIRKGDNLFVVDPKGSEGQEILAALLEESVNQKRHKEFIYLSPAFTSISDRFNMIYGMNNEAVASLLSKMVEGEQFFRDVVYKVTFAVSKAFEVLEELQCYLMPDFKERLIKRELEKYNKFIKTKGYEAVAIDEEKELYDPDSIDLMSGENEAILENEKLFKDSSDISSFLFSRTLMTLKDIAYFSRHDTLVELKDILENNFLDNGHIKADMPEWLQNEAIQAINIVNDVAKQEKAFFEKTSTSLSTILTQLITGKMGELLTSIKINPLVYKLEKDERVICLIQPFPMLFKNISDMMVKGFLYMIEYLMGKYGAKGILPKHRLHIMIDEAASVVYPNIDNLFNKAGGLGASVYAFTQSFADWEKALGQFEAKTVMDNINTQIRLRMNDPASCEIVSKEFGTVNKTEQNVMFMGSEVKYMTTTKEEWIIPPQEVRRLAVGRALAKNDENIYLLDLPYFSGNKIRLKMGELFDKKGFDIEAFDKEGKEYDRFFN